MLPPKPISSRIAPTPSGLLHMGNACNFALTWSLVKSVGGSLRLRIDDLDKARTRQAYLDDIFFTLDWLGVSWEEGPINVADHLKNHSQQNCIPLYQQAVSDLWERGWLFACTCSRKQIRLHSPDGTYPGTCRNKEYPKDHPNAALRIKTPENTSLTWRDQFQADTQLVLDQEMKDFVVRRKDGIPAYQIASLVDDLTFQTNLIVRGEDLQMSTAAQLFLAECLQQPSFSSIQWYHHPLLTDPAGHKLSKSEGALAVKSLREAGKSPAMVYQQISRWLELPEIVESSKDILALLKERK